MPQQKLQTKHWTAAIMKTPGQQRLTTMKETLNVTLNVKITCLKGGWAGGQAKVSGNKNIGTLQTNI